ncbi:aminotransferase class V-fold PLP-dependent enzyme [Acidovorax cattleyae]|nr:aminotransferase class V-fold PLP-dependent enzyme [Paracidovorax cattleyae]
MPCRRPGDRLGRTPDSPWFVATDTARCEAVRSLYDIDTRLSNLENGYWGVMARPVLEEYLRWTLRVNRENTDYARNRMGPDWRAAREAVAAAAGFDVAEVALTRGATEALQLLIINYLRLSLGDTVLYADLDYDSAQYAMDALPRRCACTARSARRLGCATCATCGWCKRASCRECRSWHQVAGHGHGGPGECLRGAAARQVRRVDGGASPPNPRIRHGAAGGGAAGRSPARVTPPPSAQQLSSRASPAPRPPAHRPNTCPAPT